MELVVEVFFQDLSVRIRLEEKFFKGVLIAKKSNRQWRGSQSFRLSPSKILIRDSTSGATPRGYLSVAH